MKLTEYSREHIQQLICDGISPAQVLRDYDAMKAIEAGEKVTNVAYDYNVSRMHLHRIRKRYIK